MKTGGPLPLRATVCLIALWVAARNDLRFALADVPDATEYATIKLRH
jgi:hypothetical protein